MSPQTIREKASLRLPPEEGPEFQIAPMVDIVFVLMLFFMACAGWQKTERELSVSLSGRIRTDIGNDFPTAIVIDVSADGRVIANDKVLGAAYDKRLPAFRDWLKDTQYFGGHDAVFIRPHPTTRHERIMEVLDACHAAGIEKVTFS